MGEDLEENRQVKWSIPALQSRWRVPQLGVGLEGSHVSVLSWAQVAKHLGPCRTQQLRGPEKCSC